MDMGAAQGTKTTRKHTRLWLKLRLVNFNAELHQI